MRSFITDHNYSARDPQRPFNIRLTCAKIGQSRRAAGARGLRQQTETVRKAVEGSLSPLFAFCRTQTVATTEKQSPRLLSQS